MSSYIMHMCISNMVKEKLNLTEKFVYGSILPDVIKMKTGDRTKTHFLSKVKVKDCVRNLPVIDKAVHELEIEDKEIKLGYIAHLVEDLIWFNDFIPTFATKIGDGKYKYLKTGEIKEAKDFTIDMYSEYLNSGAYVITSTNTDIKMLKENVEKCFEDDKCIKFMLDNIKYTKISDISKNNFMTKECIDKYIIRAKKSVEKIVLELMGE